MMVYQECLSAGGWQEILVPSGTERGKSYSVTIPPWDREALEVVCSCPGYEYRGRCRHQQEAFAFICQWSELDSVQQSEEERRGRICPECGSKTRVVIEDD